MKKTLFLGLGNPILSDDAVGIRVVQEIEKMLGDRDGICFARESVDGLRLLDVIRGYDRLIIVDAIRTRDRPGSLYELSIGELEKAIHLTCVHSINFATALRMAKEAGEKIPEEMSIYGVGVRSVREFKERMSPEVERSVPGIARRVVKKEMGERDDRCVKTRSKF